MKKKVVIFVIFILIILISIFVIKFNKVNKIINLMKENSKKLNYCYVKEDRLDSEFTVFFKRKENILIVSLISNFSTYIYYYNFNDNIIYDINSEDKVYFKRELDKFDEEVLQFPFYEFLTSDYSFKNKLKLVFEWKISNYDNDRYEITTNNNYKIIFDKKSGIALSVNNINPSQRVDKIIKKFEFDSVTDEDIELPDLSEYQELSNMN